MTCDLRQKLLTLKPRDIDYTKCTVQKSLHQQVSRDSSKTLKQQAKQFNLGNGQTFTDPIQAADYLLEREYGKSSIFNQSRHEPVFIPPVFRSNQYTKKSSLPLLDYDIEKLILETLDNMLKESKENWFTAELQQFLQLEKLSKDNIKDINAKAFNQWVLNAKIMSIHAKKLRLKKINFSTISKTDVFIQNCISELAKESPGSELETKLQTCLQKLQNKNKNGRSYLNREVEELIQQNPPEDSNMRWFFELKLPERGEEIEHKIFDRLESMNRESILNDTVILQSVCFLTNVKKKMHQEFDLVIFSWSRKLVIGIEMKRQLTDKAFDQLEKYHSLFEERLGDQFGEGWTFFPVICVGVEELMFESLHYISTKTDLQSWLESIFRHFPIYHFEITPLLPPIYQLKNVLRLIVFAIHVSKKGQIAPITTTNWVEYISEAIDSVCTSHTILFHSKEQLPALISDEPRYRKVIIKGGYGTGKSFLLQQKALLLSNDPKFQGNIMYAVHKNNGPQLAGLLERRLKYDLQKHGIGIIASTEESLRVRQVLSRGIKALFLDEWPIEEEIELPASIEVIWIASAASIRQQFINISAYTTINLTLNLRNSKEIVLEAQKIANEKKFPYADALTTPPPNFPRGCHPIYCSTVVQALDKARELTTGGILVIEGILSKKYSVYDKNKDDEWAQRVLSVGPYEVLLQGGAQRSSGADPYEILLQGGIVCVNWAFAHGFDWPTVIVKRKRSRGGIIHNHECNFLMRCTTNLFLVGEK